MSASLRSFGLAAAAVVAAALVLSALLRERPQSPPAVDPPPGFEVQVGGLGRDSTPVQTALRGAVSFLNQVEVPVAGGTRLMPVVRVDGRDPEPVGDDYMRLHEVLVTRYAETEDPDAPARVLLTVRAPEGVAPLLFEGALPSVDRRRPLEVRRPLLAIPSVLGGRDIELLTERAEIDLETNEVSAAGSFELRSAGLHVAGSDLHLDPRTRSLSFGARDGSVEWRIEDAGLTYRGRSDGGGFLEQLEDGRQLFTLPAREDCHLEFPARADAPDFFPAALDAHGARILLVRSTRGWTPERVEGDGPLRWRGPLQLLDGSACTLLWGRGGAFDGLDLTGPLFAVRAGAEPGFATGRGGGFFAPDGRTAYLYGGARAWSWLDDGWSALGAAWIDADPRWREAGGGVSAETPRLAAFADHVVQRVNGSVVLAGDALLYPDSDSLQVAAAQRMEHGMESDTRAGGGFVLAGAGAEGTAPWSLRGGTLEAEEQEGVLWLDAQEALEMRRDGAVFRGERLVARGQDYAVLSGPRAFVDVPQPDGSVWKAEAERFIQDQDGLLAQGGPVVRFPAGALGLHGDEVAMHAGAMRYRKDTNTWEWSRGAVFSGALTGGADSVTWRQGERLQLRGGAPALAGTAADQAEFRMAAQRLDIGADGSADLEGESEAQFARTNAAGVIERLHLRGTRGHLEPGGGWFAGNASAEAGERTGEAERIEWLLRERELALLQFIDDAHLDSPEGEAWGAQVNYDQRTPGQRFLEMWGSARIPARLRLPDGRDATGEWLRLDLVTRLLSSAKGTFRGGVP